MMKCNAFFLRELVKKASTGKKWNSNFTSLVCLLLLTGCMSSKTSSLALAPMPPEQRNFSVSTETPNLRYANAFVEPDLVSLEPAAAPLPVQTAVRPMPEVKDNCRFKDRFDRKAALAYEWDRSRLALDVDGVSFGSGNDVGMRVEYKLRLQPEKPKKQRCRYNSQWQGLIGSGLNELVLRENDTVWEEIRGMRKEITQHVSDTF